MHKIRATGQTKLTGTTSLGGWTRSGRLGLPGSPHILAIEHLSATRNQWDNLIVIKASSTYLWSFHSVHLWICTLFHASQPRIVGSRIALTVLATSPLQPLPEFFSSLKAFHHNGIIRRFPRWFWRLHRLFWRFRSTHGRRHWLHGIKALHPSCNQFPTKLLRTKDNNSRQYLHAPGTKPLRGAQRRRFGNHRSNFTQSWKLFVSIKQLWTTWREAFKQLWVGSFRETAQLYFQPILACW